MSVWRRRRRGWGRTSRARRYGDWALALAVLALLTLTAARLDRVATRQVAGAVTLSDGDSLWLAGEPVRLRGIDAPELSQECSRDGRAYPCGRRARQALAELTDGLAVSCEGWERDRYGRLLARCAAGGRDLGQAMVELGWAISYGDYRGAEAEARGAGRGLWAGTFRTPHDWRADRRSIDEVPHDWIGQALNFLRQLLWGQDVA
ncbi:thermonuclease family protein [Chelativorans salis]|uniref:Thermonuclease family protein n=1 Tax=Chelativorans salis TaxID=2978478 RepID=A0ABT2LLR2_9HYPH|nr:thermonuclease family protein [Chelativorans sp. EGI FJ00035]MCT7375531.1 thermonuclease family protein [Chelativorans sp. EGI FJ00035]